MKCLAPKGYLAHPSHPTIIILGVLFLLWTTPLFDAPNALGAVHIPVWFVPMVPSLVSWSQELQGVSRVADRTPCSG